MLFSSWLRNWKGSLERRWALNRTRRPRSAARRLIPRLGLEVLEDRTLLSPYIVTTTADSGAGSLRDAITQINADTSHALYASPSNPSVDKIDFNITAASDTGGGYNSTTGVATIKPQAALSPITNSVILNGYTQGQGTSLAATPNTLAQGDNAVLKIQLDLSNISVPGGFGLYVFANNSTISGLVVNDLTANLGIDAIFLQGDQDQVQGSFLGTDVSGSTIVGGGGGTAGISIFGSANSEVVGGTTPAARNVIAGFATGIAEDYGSGAAGNPLVEGNYIGTDASGTKALGNQTGVALGGNGGVIGGLTSTPGTGAGNLISGNQTGITSQAGNPTQIQGNLIGTDATGENALGNVTGMRVGYEGGATNPELVGGTTSAARNVISGNTSFGIVVTAGGPPGEILIEGNYIGTDAKGAKAVGNGSAGLWLLGGDVTVGGTAPGAGNVISGNPAGMRTFDQGYNIEGNLIGTDATGATATGTDGKTLGNGTGILMQDGGNNNIISDNVISGNSTGIFMHDLYGPMSGNVIEGNKIGTDITGSYAIGNINGVRLGVNATGNTIGGTTAAARNLISGNVETGIVLGSFGNGVNFPSNNVMEGNYIGTDATGTTTTGTDGKPLSNGEAGVLIAEGTNNTIGGLTSTPGTGAGNLISGNGDGVYLGYGLPNFTGGGYAATGNLVEGNLISHNGGGVGVESINNTVGGTAAGSGNVIASNGGDGVFVGNGATGVSILSNSVSASGGLGIHLDSASNANHNQAAPVLTSASSSSSSTTISGTLVSLANTTFRIEFFANSVANPSGYGEGLTLLGAMNVTTDANGNASFTAALPALPAGQTILSATATNLTANDTSQFSNDVSIPSVGPITAPLAPTAINTTINASASFTDAFTNTTHTAVWNWGDGTTSSGAITESNGSGTVTGSHAYAVNGVYTVTLTVTNNLGGSGQSVFNYVVVYNPSAGFSTGGGWFNSPAGADTANPTLTGKASFGFNAKYQSGSTVPTGQTEFQFPAANLDFHSTSYDWLVINGSQAQYQGSGTINGAGNYGFVVTVTDNDASSGGGADTIRIQIWDKNNNNAVVYDTQPGAAITATPTTPLGGGDIQVHANTTKMATVAITNGGTTTPGASQSTPVAGSSNSSSTPTPVATSTPAASASSVSSNAGSWLAFEASLLDSLERDLSQWENRDIFS